MSSILKALKKLESEKSQRDELSTAVASDILRSSRDRKHHTVLKVAAGCFLVVLIAVGGYLFATRTSNDQPAQTASKATIVTTEPAVTTLEAKPSPAETEKPPKALNLPQLSGIIYQPVPEDRLAIINDLPVMEGTLVDDFEVKTILPDRVILQRGPSEFTLVLKQ